MKTLKNIISSAIWGIGMATFMSVILCYIFGYEYSIIVPSFAEKFPTTLTAVTVQCIISGLIGISQYISKKIFSMDASLLTLTLAHNFCIALPLLIGGSYLEWFKLDLINFLGFLFMIELIYIICYIYSFLSYKNETNKINAKLQ